MKHYAPWLSLALVGLAGCAVTSDDAVDDDTSQAASPIRGAADTDTTYGSVGMLRNANTNGFFCTATLIAPDVAMSAAHCFSELANGCTTPAAAMSANRFVLDTDGDGAGVAYEIDEVAFAPGAYVPAASNCTASGSVYECSGFRYPYVDKSHDLMLLHLRVPAGAPANPPTMPVLTSLADDTSNAFGVHARLDAANGAFTAAGAALRPVPFAVGYGSGDDCTLRRRSGRMVFDDPRRFEWHRSCVQGFSCGSANPTPSSCSFVRADGTTGSYPASSGTYFKSEVIRLARHSTRAGAYDGVLPTNGDSGSPLAASLPAWGHPQIALGTFSTGFQSACGAGALPPGYLADTEYAPTFSPENGRFIEQTRAYWATRFARRALGWHRTLDSLGGALTTAPAAASSNDLRLDVFGRGGDNFLWINTFASAPERWSRLDATRVFSAPSVTSMARGRLDVFSTNASGNTLHWYSNSNGRTYAAPENLGGVVLSGTATATAGRDGYLYAFVTGAGNRLYTKRYVPTVGWLPSQRGWTVLDAAPVMGTAAAISWAADAVDVFVRLPDGSLGRKWRRPDSRGWMPVRGYERLGGSLASDPAAVSWGAGRIDVFYRPAGDGTAIVQRTMEDNVWSPAVTLPVRGGRANARLTAASFAPGRIDLYVRGRRNQLLHTWFPNE